MISLNAGVHTFSMAFFTQRAIDRLLMSSEVHAKWTRVLSASLMLVSSAGALSSWSSM